MKKINFLFLLLGLFSLTFLVSCGTEDEVNPPILTISPNSAQEIVEGDTLSVSLTAGENPTSKKALKTLVIKLDGATLETVNLSGSTYANDFDFVVPAARTAAYVYTFELTDRDDKSATRTLNVTSVEETPVTTPLSSATVFTWQRVGGPASSSPDLALFGLTWSSQTVTNAIISNATKLVELPSTEWTSLSTVEDLEAAVTAATGVTSVNVPFPNSSINKVIATLKGGTYYLIYIQSSTSAAGAAGTTVTITGNYKN